MHRTLYMICPSDYLESVISKRFDGQKFFFTSLGNTFTIDHSELKQIAALVKENYLDEITLILSEDNSFILDALNGQSCFGINGLSKAYSRLNKHKRQAVSSINLDYQHAVILSYHLNEKINELKYGLYSHLKYLPLINGKLFSKPSNSFKQIYPELVCINSINLN